MFTTALEEGELITAIRFPIPKRAAYIKFKQPASRFALIGVFVAQTDSGVRVAVTGGGNGVFRHTGLEQALSKSFTPEAAAGGEDRRQRPVQRPARQRRLPRQPDQRADAAGGGEGAGLMLGAPHRGRPGCGQLGATSSRPCPDARTMQP